ncbi:hypothetical protein [Pseudotabrizicola sediminis]|uniref:hypothetical protein n=1 Tax=Pseudotabrizicola sediminis TaxID=2486418 RepID=UPI0014366C82|nr:hypothetical protein [Pseudotabrizicola sediminis]
MRALSPGKQLGVAWYRFPDEDHNKDGRHFSYLEQPHRFASLEPELFHHLRAVVKDVRSIASLLPVLQSSSSSDESLDTSAVPNRLRRNWRSEWFSRVLIKLSACNLVFADPDYGIVDDSDARKGSARFGKQMPLEEVRALAQGRCAVIYHHNTRRRGGHDAEVDHWLQQIGLPGLAVRASACSPRTFFVLNPGSETAQRVGAFCDRWHNLRVRLHTAG